ncbi:MAG: tail fiber domain-containing protein, partial [Acinetobacter sp.]
ANSHVWFRNSAGTSEKALIFAENQGVLKVRTNWVRQCTHQIGNGMIWLVDQNVNTSDAGLIRGTVQGGAWVAWRERAAGLLVDCPNSRAEAYNIWKATHWGEQHIAAMGVHAGAGNPSVVLHVGSSDYSFDNGGTFSCPGNGHFNDVYIRSDKRLKTNLVKVDSAMDKVNQLTAYHYDKRADLESENYDRKEVGILADDLEKVLPEAVSITNGVKVISASGVNALLINALKEANKRIENLEAVMAAK